MITINQVIADARYPQFSEDCRSMGMPMHCDHLYTLDQDDAIERIREAGYCEMARAIRRSKGMPEEMTREDAEDHYRSVILYQIRTCIAKWESWVKCGTLHYFIAHR